MAIDIGVGVEVRVEVRVEVEFEVQRARSWSELRLTVGFTRVALKFGALVSGLETCATAEGRNSAVASRWFFTELVYRLAQH